MGMITSCLLHSEILKLQFEWSERENRSRNSPSEPSTWQLHWHTLGFVVSPGHSEMALICFSVINKPVVIFRRPSAGFPPHIWRRTHEVCIYSSGRYCDRPDITGQIILLLHLASRETQDRLSRSETASQPPPAALMSKARLKGNTSEWQSPGRGPAEHRKSWATVFLCHKVRAAPTWTPQLLGVIISDTGSRASSYTAKKSHV